MKTLVTILFVVLIVNCGGWEEQKEQQKDEPSMIDGTMWAEGDYYGDSGYLSSYFTVEGYISPINITVNDTPYSDSEDFYTQELAKLQKEVKTEYPDHKLSFDAAVGLRQFKSGMYVFLVASSENGVASETYIDSSGKFSFVFDEGEGIDKKSMYTLRASKRIGLRLINGNDVITWCYNMYAEKEMALEVSPVILRHFHTKVTKYQCSEQNQGITLPESEYPDYESEYDEPEEDTSELSVDTSLDVTVEAKGSTKGSAKIKMKKETEDFIDSMINMED